MQDGQQHSKSSRVPSINVSFLDRSSKSAIGQANPCPIVAPSKVDSTGGDPINNREMSAYFRTTCLGILTFKCRGSFSACSSSRASFSVMDHAWVIGFGVFGFLDLSGGSSSSIDWQRAASFINPITPLANGVVKLLE